MWTMDLLMTDRSTSVQLTKLCQWRYPVWMSFECYLRFQWLFAQWKKTFQMKFLELMDTFRLMSVPWTSAQ